MLSNFLVKKFIKNNHDIHDNKVRIAYGNLGGIVGIIINSLLFLIKLFVGLFAGSIAIMADAFNNLSDAASSIITIIGFKMANKPADAEHPFGHGRIEYLSALIVSFMVMLVGIQFVKTSFSKILNPEDVTFEIIPFILLLVSIGFKIWLSRFNKNLGNKINSSALKAAGTDALGDVFTSTTVVISFLASNFTTLPIDGYIGVLVALIIIYSGFNLIKETISPLLGEAPDVELVKQINEMVLSYEHISGVHDLIIHNYGPGRVMASIHAEIPADINIMTIHNIIDSAEREISKKLGVYLVVHMDPVSVDTDEISATRRYIEEILKSYSIVKSYHDFRVIGDEKHKNIIFDVVVDSNEFTNKFKSEDLKESIEYSVKLGHPTYNCIVTIDLQLN
ncbi:MAG: cation diffusion facilitator family transporter [Clostridium sp.]|nr:cation diffusion facilitator family transporter [Clostridium sp.]